MILKLAYRLRFVPLVLSLVFLILSIIILLTVFSGLAMEMLPYQDPTPEMLEMQMQNIYLWRQTISQVFLITIIGFVVTVLYTMFLLYLRYKRKSTFDDSDESVQS